MKKILQLTVLLTLMIAQISLAQDHQIKGKVTDGSDGSAVAGVTVKVKGTSRGTVTDSEGNYKINVGNNTVLLFSSVGFSTKEMSVGNASELNVVLAISTNNIDEVVITSYGIAKDKKILSYATQSIQTQTFSQAKDLNVTNSLVGRVAGLDIARASTGVGAASRITLRGDRSITGNNQALIVIDGVQGGDLSSINQDDIEAMNVLRGAAATALYGSRAANGAIVVSTKKGLNRKGLGVTFNSSYIAESAIQLRQFQNDYIQGSGGKYDKASEYSWGPKFGGTVAAWGPSPAAVGQTYTTTPQPNSYYDFYNTGGQLSNAIGISGGGEKTQTYFSYTNVGASGIVDNNKLKRNNFNLRIANQITDKLSLDSKITFLNQSIDNAQSTGDDFANVSRHTVRLPRNIPLSEAQNFEYTDPITGRVRQNYWNPGSNGGENPYWIKNRVLNSTITNHIYGFSSATYKFTPAFSVMARGGLDLSVNNFENKRYTDTYTIAQNGNYTIGSGRSQEVNLDLLAFYKAHITEKLTVDATAGGTIQKISSISQSSDNGGLNRDNLFIPGNARNSVTSNTLNEREKHGLFATGDFTYNNLFTVSVSARNDWSSTLPTQNQSYFFPAAGFSAIISQIVDLPQTISFLKVRGSYALTGNDADPYLINQTYTFSQGGPNGFFTRDALKPFPDLKPEITKALEFGIDVKLFKNRLGIDLGWYNSNSENQLLKANIPPASGWTQKYINAGLVNNSGIELIINANIVKTKDFSWDIDLNYARNVNNLVTLTPDLKQYALTSDFGNYSFAIEGRPLGEIYGRGYVRDANNNIVVGTDGLPQITNGPSVYLGNTRPAWTGGMANRFTYKSFSLSALISARIGGIVSSFTNAVTYADGTAAETLAGRDGFVFQGVQADGTPNKVSITAEQYWLKVGGRNTPAMEVFTYSASNIRLRELVFGYKLPSKLMKRTPFQSASLSVVGRNLFFIVNNAKSFDPESVTGTANTSPGIESFSLPATRSFGVNLSLSF